MPLAHICPSCGNQLARTRAVPDAVYALPIVVCNCGLAAVRRPHPLLVHWRRARAAFCAALFLILHFVVIFFLSMANGGFAVMLEKDLRDNSLTPGAFILSLFGGAGRPPGFQRWLDDGGGRIFIIGFAMVSIAAGIWLRAAFSHWRWPRPILAWAVLISCWAWIETLFWPLTWLDGRITGVSVKYSGPGFQSSLHLAEILLASLLVSTAATPIGRLVGRGLTSSRHQRFIKRLNKRRRTRRGE